MPESRLNDLISQYHHLLERGQPADAAELTRSCPDLLPELLRRLEVLARFQPHEASTLHADAPGTATWTAEPPPSPPGLQVLGEIARGGMGVVYKALHKGLNRVVALKMIKPGNDASDEGLARFRAEAEAIARLDHPNIVQIHEVGCYEGRPYFILEYCEGGSLADRLRDGPLQPADAAPLVEKVARAAHAAHLRDVVHRDLTPNNVLFTASGTPRITDFGLAKRLDDDGRTRTGAVMGTPSYMAPEQALGYKSVGPPADIYSLGVILYECLTGRPPFTAATWYDTVEQVVTQDPVPPRRLNPKVPRDLETICLKCLHKTPGRRYATALELADDLRHFRDGEPIKARPVGSLERIWKGLRRRPAVSALAAALVVVMAVSLATITWLYRDALRQADAARTARQEAEERTDTTRYAYQLDQARRALDEEQYDQAAALLDLCEERLRGWEHGHLRLQLAERLRGPGVPLGGAGLSDEDARTASRIALPRGTFTVEPGRRGAVLRETRSRLDLAAIAGEAEAAGMRAEPQDRDVVLTDARNGKHLLRGHTARVTHVLFTPDGRRMITAAAGEMKLWCPRTGVELLSFKLPPEPLQYLGLDRATGCVVGVSEKRADVFFVSRPHRPPSPPDRLVLLRLIAAESFRDWGDVLAEARRLLETRPGSLYLHAQQARALWQLDRRDEAVAALAAASRHRGDDPLSWWLDHDAAGLLDPDQFLPAVEEKLRAQPGDWPLWALRGWCLLLTEQFGAADDLKKAAKAGDRPDLWALFIQAALAEGRPREADEGLMALNRLAGPKVAAWHERVRPRKGGRGPGSTYFWHLDALIRAGGPQEPDLRHERGLARALVQQWGGAAEDLGRVIQAGRDNVSIRCLHARALALAGDRAGYQRACAALLRHPAAANTAARVAWACVLAPGAFTRADDWARLIRLAQQARPLEAEPDVDEDAVEKVGPADAPEQPQALLLGAALLRAGRPGDAIRILTGPSARDDEPTRRMLLLALRAAGMHREADRRELRWLAARAPVRLLGVPFPGAVLGTGLALQLARSPLWVVRDDWSDLAPLWLHHPELWARLSLQSSAPNMIGD